MNPENLIKTLENNLIALEAKKKVSIEKGSLGLLDIFNKEFIETSVTLELIKKGLGEGTKSIAAVQERMDEVIKDNSEYLQSEILKLREDSLRYFNDILLGLKTELDNEKDLISNKLQEFRIGVDLGMNECKSHVDIEIDTIKTSLENKIDLIQNAIQDLTIQRDKTLKEYSEGFKNDLQVLSIGLKNDLQMLSTGLNNELQGISDKYGPEIARLHSHLKAYSRGNRFIRAWKVLVGKL